MFTGFLDTNILIYAYSPSDERKQRIARGLMRAASFGEHAISTQVLAEFAVTLVHKRKFPVAEVSGALSDLELLPTVLPDWAVVQRALEAQRIYSTHLYDGMIIAAAERAGCERIYSEDFNAGQSYFGIEVVNPFA